MGVWVEVTTLLIPGRNDGDGELRSSRRSSPRCRPTSPGTSPASIPSYRLLDTPPTPVATVEKALRIGREAGLRYVYGGNVPGHASESTVVPVVRERWSSNALGFRLSRNRAPEGRCPGCGQQIAGLSRGGLTMALVGCFVTPHPPIIIPEVGGPQSGRSSSRQCAAMTRRAGEGRRARPRHHRAPVAAQPPARSHGRLARRFVPGLPRLLPGARTCGWKRPATRDWPRRSCKEPRRRDPSRTTGCQRGSLRSRPRGHGAAGVPDWAASNETLPAGPALVLAISGWRSTSASGGPSVRRSCRRRSGSSTWRAATSATG